MTDEYSKKNKDKEWTSVQMEMFDSSDKDFKIEQLKSQWANLRAQYNTNKRLKMKRTGSGAETVEPKWLFFEAMLFLDSADVVTKRVCSVKASGGDDAGCSSTSEKIVNVVDDSDEEEKLEIESQTASSTGKLTPKAAKKRKSDSDDRELALMEQLLGKEDMENAYEEPELGADMTLGPR